MIAYASRAKAGLYLLGKMFGVGYGAPSRAAVDALFQGWGHRMSRSDVAGPDPAPYEYSVALPSTPESAEVRFFFRPLASAGTTSVQDTWVSGWRMLAALDRNYGVPLARARLLTDLFEPVSQEAAGGLFVGAAITPLGLGGVKVYFDGMAKGRSRNIHLMEQACDLLGFREVRQWLQARDIFDHMMPSFSVDLLDNADARSKLYTTIYEATASDIEDRLAESTGIFPRDGIEICCSPFRS